MKEKVVGKFKRVTYDEETGEMDFTITVTDSKFKKKLLRELHLSGNLKVVGDSLVYVPQEGDDNAEV
jgi:hypothetical protein